MMRSPRYVLLSFALGLAPLSAQTVTLKPTDTGMRVEIDGQLFTEYVTQNTPRPFLYPVIGAGGESVTRNFPMRTDVLKEKKDHKHHRSIWFGHGNVNGTDFWSEDKDFGREEHVAFRDQKAEGNKASFNADTRWVTAKGALVLTDTRHIAVTALPQGEKYLDFEITLKATQGEVTFADTKEGTMALRLCTSLSLENNLEAHAYNSNDVRGKDVWGKRADWVCFYGPDPKGTQVGVVVFSHPTNLRSPEPWHARPYGLLAANPFGLHDFEGGSKSKGDYTIAEGDSLTFNYRYYLSKGKPRPDDVREKFAAYTKEVVVPEELLRHKTPRGKLLKWGGICVGVLVLLGLLGALLRKKKAA